MKKRSQKYGQALSGAPSVPIERMFSARASAHRAAGIGYARVSYIYIFKVDRNQKCNFDYGQKYGAGGVDRNQKCKLEYGQK